MIEISTFSLSDTGCPQSVSLYYALLFWGRHIVFIIFVRHKSLYLQLVLHFKSEYLNTFACLFITISRITYHYGRGDRTVFWRRYFPDTTVPCDKKNHYISILCYTVNIYWGIIIYSYWLGLRTADVLFDPYAEGNSSVWVSNVEFSYLYIKTR